MQNYLVAYMASEDTGDFAWTDAFSARFMAAWGEWAVRREAAIVDGGAPVGRTRRVDGEGISEMRNGITGYTIVRATSHDEAAAMFIDHPHATMLPGTWIEVMACLDLPTM